MPVINSAQEFDLALVSYSLLLTSKFLKDRPGFIDFTLKDSFTT